MSEHDERAAEALDRAIDAMHEGDEPRDIAAEQARVLRHLSVVYASAAPSGLAERVRTAVVSARRPSRVLRLTQLAAALLGALYLFHGLPHIFAGERVAEFLRLEYEPHIYTEEGIALLAVAAVLLLGALRARYLRAGILVGVPLSVALAVFGVLEIGHAPQPAAEFLHFAQGAVALALLGLWWRLRRTA
jgi:hypothetical protein